MTHVFVNEHDWIAADDLDEAWRIYAEYIGYEDDVARARQEIEDGDPLVQMADDAIIKIHVDAAGKMTDDYDSTPLALTAAEWVAREGKGHLCSTEY